MAANPRKSEYSKNKKGKVGRGNPFLPNLKEWTEACELYCYDKQIFQHFDICAETFYSFLDRQRYAEEQGNNSEYLAAYKSGRNKGRSFALNSLKKLTENGEVAATIFTAKTYGGLLEAKDIKHIELKKYEVAFRTKQFLTELGNKFSLNFEELKDFADKYFKDTKLDNI